MLAGGGSNDDVLAYLKREGGNAIASIKALQQLLGVSMAEAQQILHDSDAWRGMRQDRRAPRSSPPGGR
jgi:hypothetical protein